jgi:hypothetical protein
MSTNPTNPSPNLAGVLYFEFFFKKLYLLYIGTEGVLHKAIMDENLIVMEKKALDGMHKLIRIACLATAYRRIHAWFR